MKQNNSNAVLSSNPKIVKEAILCASQGALDEWVITYLVHIDKNPGFVEGLRRQRRWWVGPQDYQLRKLHRTCGPEATMDFPETTERWESRVKQMVESVFSGWSAPPIIVEYASEGLLIRDGNHRQEALLRIGLQKYPIIAWFNTLNDLTVGCDIQPHTFFLTGTSGSGKSTIVESVQRCLPFVSVHDFDEGGVPEGADEKWRMEKTNSWLEVAWDNQKKGITTIICGVSVPAEVKQVPAYSKELSVHYGVVHTEPHDVRKRLRKRGWSDSLIEDNITWAQHLERFVMAEPDKFFVDSSKYNPDKVTERVCNWIIGKIATIK